MTTQAEKNRNEHTTTPTPGCMICEQIFDPDRKTVIEAEEFVGYVSDVYPWAIMLSAKRHDCDGPWSLNQAEASELGRMIPLLSKAIRGTGTEMVYVLNFGEGVPVLHYHVAFFSRFEEISEVVHEVLYRRVAAEAPDPAAVSTKFAADVRAQLVVGNG
jgi:diadenosine tetraphosphate (Ap4A) HIT family hydrolase